MFHILGINHVGIVPKDVKKAKAFLGDLLGLPFNGSEDVADQKTATHFFGSSSFGCLKSTESRREEVEKRSLLPVNEHFRPTINAESGFFRHPRLELLEALGGDSESPIARFLEKKGSGIHHIALAVDSVEEAIKYLQSKNVKLIDQSPRSGAHHTKVAFVHPEATGGILIELVEEATRS